MTEPTISLEEREFTLFSRLPTELRVIIWKECYPKSRVIEVADNEHDGVPKDIVTLKINQESRHTTLEDYRLIYDHRASPIYFDPKIDFICVNSIGYDTYLYTSSWNFKEAEFTDATTAAEVQNLKLLYGFVEELQDGISEQELAEFHEFLPYFPDLKNLVMEVYQLRDLDNQDRTETDVIKDCKDSFVEYLEDNGANLSGINILFEFHLPGNTEIVMI
ncbi:hypothetical protein B7494_g971 [Chlorociboria aeruginascens]|nr:hypothetical protein B7494_g971 [Chlorociboria aeruginascens]